MASAEQIARNLALNGAKLPPRPEREKRADKIGKGITRKTPLNPGKRPKAESPKQADLNKRWRFIRACFLRAQKLTDGFYSCMECGARYTNAKQVQLHHIERRGQGGDYTIDNAMLVGSGPGTCQCHERLDGNLLHFSGGRTA